MSDEPFLDAIEEFYEQEKATPEYAIAEVAAELRNRGEHDLAARLWEAIEQLESA